MAQIYQYLIAHYLINILTDHIIQKLSTNVNANTTYSLIFVYFNPNTISELHICHLVSHLVHVYFGVRILYKVYYRALVLKLWYVEVSHFSVMNI